MPRVALLVITDGRPCLQQTLASAEEFLLPYIDGPTLLVTDIRHELGLSGAVTKGWSQFDPPWYEAGKPECDYLFHLEDDFIFTAPVPVAEMVALCGREELAQVALKRDAANPLEHALGGFMEASPHNYVQRDGWVESRFGFTLNPCVVPARLLDLPCENGEAGLTAIIKANYPDIRFGIYGNLTDPPRCHHIGVCRSPGWKL